MEQTSIRAEERTPPRRARTLSRRAAQGFSRSKERALFRLREAQPRSRRGNVGNMERMASAAAGSALLVSGLVRGSVAGVLMAVGGGALVYRGMRGHCPVYQALDVNTARPRTSANEAAQQLAPEHEQMVADGTVLSAASGA